MNDLLVAIVGTLIAAIVALEARAWFPRFCQLLIELAVKRLPKRQRARYAEEWHGHIGQVPGAVMKLWDGLGFVIGAGSMFPEWQRRIASRKSMVRRLHANRLTIRTLDLAFSATSLVILAPMLTFFAVLNSFSGPSLYRQRIKSPAGSAVFVTKFRTMQIGEEQTTRLGKFMRRASIDELPVLFSVLWGDISLIAVEKPGIIPSSYVPPSLTVRGSPVRTALAYIGTVCRMWWHLARGRA